VSITKIDDLDSWLEEQEGNAYFFSSHAKKSYTEICYTDSDILIFGSETSGLPNHYFERYPSQFYTIPMRPGQRCLNLSNSASIVLYEGLRQQGFAQLT
jgi:tRNA (cytidine/uridine-2'-O-)-methyltransferase